MESRHFLLTEETQTPVGSRQEVKKILEAQDENSLKTLTYYTYNPSNKKTISVASHRAINKIAYLEPKLIVDVLKLLAQSLTEKTPKAVPKNDLFVVLRNLVAEMSKLKEDFVSNNIKKLSDKNELLIILNKFYETCVYIFNNPKDHDLNNKKEFKALLSEIITWFDGLYLQLSIKKDRKIIENILNDNSVSKLNLIDNPIAVEIPKKIITKEKDAIDHIKKMSRTQSNPILNDIFIEAFRKTKHLAATNMALEILYQTAETLSKSYSEQKDYFTAKKHDILPQLGLFKERMKSFPINEDTKYLAKEMALFFEAGYVSAGDKLGVLNDTYMRFNTSDVKGGPLDRLKIATYFLEIAQALRQSITQFAQQKLVQPLLQPQPAPQQELQPEPSPVIENRKKEEVEVPVVVNENPIILEVKPELTDPKNTTNESKEEILHQQETKQELTKEQVASTVVAAPPPIQKDNVETKPVSNEYEFWLRLDKAKDISDKSNDKKISEDVKIQTLGNTLNELSLSKNQESWIAHIKPKLLKQCELYKKNTYTRGWLEYLIPYFGPKLESYFDRSNKDIAEEIIKKFNEGDLRLSILFLVHTLNEKFPGRASRTLEPTTRETLLEIFIHLHNMKPPKPAEALWGSKANSLNSSPTLFRAVSAQSTPENIKAANNHHPSPFSQRSSITP